MASFMLIGLCEPLEESGQAAFDEWFIDQHIEDIDEIVECLDVGPGRKAIFIISTTVCLLLLYESSVLDYCTP